MVLHRWRSESKDYGKNSFPGRGKPKLTDEQKEIALLKRHLKDVSEENEILSDNLTTKDTIVPAWNMAIKSNVMYNQNVAA